MRLLVAWMLIAVALSGCASQDQTSHDPEPGGGPDPGTDPPRDDPPPLRQVDFSWDLEEPEPGQSIVFTADAPGASGLAWDFGDGASGQGREASHAYDAKGVYQVGLVASYAEGPDASRSRILNVGESVPVDPERDAPVIRWEQSELTIRFFFDFEGEADAVGWDFGDGGTSNDASPEHAYSASGTYMVRLSILEGDTFHKAEQLLEVDTELPTFFVTDVGRDGEEPSLGITSDRCIFFIARWDVMRSCNGGRSWTEVSGPLAPVIDSDPYLWVDADTDRVFRVNMLHLACTQIGYTDNGGGMWVQNPADCGPAPVNDHIKLATGPWTDAGYGVAGSAGPAYPNAVYFCYNKLVGVYCYTSFDGGLTFPIGGLVVGMAGTGGLHGAIETAPDGTVYVPPRLGTPTVYTSKDNGLTWSSRTMGQDVGTPSPRKNSEVATDTESNAYHTWVGADFGVYMSRSTDSGSTWEQRSIRVSPDHIPSTTFPHIDAGDPGRIAVAYLGSENHAGNPHEAPAGALYHLYVTFSLDALADKPSFTTVRVTEDPVQVGSICISSGDCSGGNRNLLDFNDLHIGPDGRVHVAFTDGCTGTCAASAGPTPAMSRSGLGSVAVLDTGPSLYEDVGPLRPFSG